LTGLTYTLKLQNANLGHMADSQWGKDATSIFLKPWLVKIKPFHFIFLFFLAFRFCRSS